MSTDPPHSPAQAFEALRAEVAAMRTEQQEIAARSLPDYDLTLGQMIRQLEALTSRIAGLEAQQLGDVLGSIVARQGSQMVNFVETAVAAVSTQAAALDDAIGEVRTRVVWRRRLAGIGGAGMLAGILLCLGIAALFPKASGAWMAAEAIGDPWIAGATLMQQAEPAAFQRMIRLYDACPRDVSVDLCAAAMAVRAAGEPVK